MGGYGDGTDRTDLRPCLAVVGAAIDPYCPGRVAFDGGAADDRAVVEDERLVFDWAEKACEEMVGLRPGVGFVGADEAGAGPCADVRSEFVVQPEFAVGGVEENWIPAGDVGFANQDIRGRPLIGGAARGPDCGVGSALGCSSEPCGEEIAVRQFDDGGCVCGGEGS